MTSLEEQLRLEITAHGENTSLAQMLRTQLFALKTTPIPRSGLTRDLPKKARDIGQGELHWLGWQTLVEDALQPGLSLFGKSLQGGGR